MTLFVPIVEGTGEVLSVERLLWRIGIAAVPAAPIRVNPPIRVKSGSFINDSQYRDRYVHLAVAKARQAEAIGTVLVLLDCEDECPAKLGPQLLRQVEQAAAGVHCLVALAHREYETWFIAAVESLRGVEGLDPNASPPIDPEMHRDAKGWLGRLLPHRYDPVTHQLPFTVHFDLHAARRVPSFDRLFRKVSALIQETS